jgi:hypothetical protein
MKFWAPSVSDLQEVNKFASSNHKIGVTASPIVQEHTLSAQEAKMINQIDLGPARPLSGTR